VKNCFVPVVQLVKTISRQFMGLMYRIGLRNTLFFFNWTVQYFSLLSGKQIRKCYAFECVLRTYVFSECVWYCC
jgi:hypothetical protein